MSKNTLSSTCHAPARPRRPALYGPLWAALLALVLLVGCSQRAQENIESWEQQVTELVDPDAPLKVTEEQRLEDITGDAQSPGAMLSPDGSALAWARVTGARPKTQLKELCIYSFADRATGCYEKPEAFEGPPVHLEWSPDGAYIAFTEDPLVMGNESDVWLFRLADRSYTNRTDDGVQGSYYTQEGTPYVLDYLPMWNQADGKLYFWRSVPIEFARVTRELYRLSPEGGEPEQVRDVSEYFQAQLLVFDLEFYYMDGVSSISPDGTQVAMISYAFEDAYAEQNGLWVLDLDDSSAPPRQIANMDAFQAALPSFQWAMASPVGLSWTADSSGVVVLSISETSSLKLLLFYHADMADGGLTPVVDFSGYDDTEPFFTEVLPSGLPARYYSPWTATLSPAGTKLVMYADLSGVPGLLVAPQPPGDGLPVYAHKPADSGAYPVARASRSRDGKVLIYQTLFTTTED